MKSTLSHFFGSCAGKPHGQGVNTTDSAVQVMHLPTGTGDRSEKIRTHNFPQNRVTNHRLNLTLYYLDRFIAGDINEMIGSLQAADVASRLEEAQNGAAA